MGPKKGGRNRDAPKKSQKSQQDEVSIDDFLASGSKDGKGKAKGPAQGKGKQKDTAGAEPAGDHAKKPSVRSVIGGASWTGKLPVNLLSEHCQKQKWEKPEYNIIKTTDGFLASVTLKKSNPKTQETTTLPPIRLPASHKHLALQPTALEARHFAAAYALFRVCSMRNLHMMMPPTYKNLWKDEFEPLKKQDVAQGNGWMYEADPFAAHQERSNAAAAAEAAKLRSQQAKEAEQKKNPLVKLGPGAGSGDDRSIGRDAKYWARVPRVEMGSKTRRQVEELVRQRAMWNPYNLRIPEPQASSIVEELSGLGFRRSHVEEAVAECKDREEVLEWLLIHVPEDDLPKWSLPEGYSAGVILASGDLAREAKIKRLAAGGYSGDLCAEMLYRNGDDEEKAAESLQNALLHEEIAGHSKPSPQSEEIWAEEIDTLEATFGDRCMRLSPFRCQVKSDSSYPLHPVTFVFQKPCTRSYPDSPPVILIVAEKMPAYIRLSATRQALRHAQQDLVGAPMIFSLVDWLEDNLPRILESPGKLRNISVEALPPVSRGGPGAMAPNCLKKPMKKLNFGPEDRLSAEIRAKWEERQSSPEQQKILNARKALPAWAMQEAIVKAVNSYQVTIISGETGSGKSTQSVQFVLDDLIRRGLGAGANIVCTQPRRISALGLADRVSAERCSAVGDEVGYTVRGDSKVRPGLTKITFMTTGVLLRRIQVAGENITESLADITHVVVDEVHERSLDTDILLALMREVLQNRKDLKLILMSATLDADVFIRYFGGISQVGRVNIEGRTYPVEDLYIDDVIRKTGFRQNWSDSAEFCEELEQQADIARSLRALGMGINYDLIASTVRYIDSQFSGQAGSILIFLPGTMEIERCLGAMRDLPFAHLLPLHASLPPNEQRRVFQPPPPGKRKVIAATNVAETSITIEDIVAVIDTGRVKETRYDPADNIVRLEETWASRAACKQRRGRAGRVRNGVCYKLYTRNAESNMIERPEPEIRRVPLEQLCLTAKAMRGIQDVAAFLANTLTPPESMAVEGAMNFLHRIGALDNGQLTALGRYLSIVPTDLRCAKLMIYGAIFGCMEPCLTIAAILTVKSPFTSVKDQRDKVKEIRSVLANGDGDLLADLNAYRRWEERVKTQGYRKTQSWCYENGLIPQTLREISSNRAQLLTSLKDVGILPIDYHDTDSTWNNNNIRWNCHKSNTRLLRALIAGAFNPQVASISFPDKKFAPSMTGTVELDPEARTIKYFNQENGRVFVHPSSTLFDAQSFSGAASYVAYYAKIATSKVFIRDLTPFNAYSLLLFAGPISLDTLGRGVIVDGWLRLRGWARIGVLVSRLRMILDEAISRKLDNPNSTEDEGEEDEVIRIVRHLILLNGQDH
ncbi:hypothetical protein VTO42DRAFT_7315 [Malbranchea cinnamomea]